MSEMVLIRSDDGTLERLKVGDANSPVCYRLICSCKANLGPLASFVEKKDDEGKLYRFVRCGRCDLCTVVQGARVLVVVPLGDLPEKYRPRGVLIVPETASRVIDPREMTEGLGEGS
jgi:hypothetical protein